MDIETQKALAGENRTKLIVNYLPQTMSDDEFRLLFMSYGEIISSQIVRDKMTDYSYGFGFVEYQEPEQAEEAIRHVNGFQTDNKRLKVALSRPSGEDTKGANLRITGLQKNITETELCHLFSEYGTIINCKILMDSATGMSKGVGFVLFDQRKQAELAISSLDGTVLFDSPGPIRVHMAGESKRAPSILPVRGGGAIRMTSRGRGVKRFNPLSSYHAPSPYPQGIPSLLDCVPHPIPPTEHVLFVYNIGLNATENTLWQLFSPFGAVTKVDVIYDGETKQCKGYGFVTMTRSEEAITAIRRLNGHPFNGKRLQVSFRGEKNSS